MGRCGKCEGIGPGRECESETCVSLDAQVGDLGTLVTIPASGATAGASEEACEVEAKVAVAAEVADEVHFYARVIALQFLMVSLLF